MDGLAPGRLEFAISLALFGLLLLIVLFTASLALRRSFQGPDAPRRVLVASLIISVVALLATTLILWGLTRPQMSLLFEPTPLLGIGLLWLYVGYLAVIAGGVLVYMQPPRQTVPQVA